MRQIFNQRVKITETKTPTAARAPEAVAESVIAHAPTPTKIDASARQRWGSLDALAAHTAVIDADGHVCWANAGWDREVRDRAQRPVESLGTHYTLLCSVAFGFDRESVSAISEGLRRVLAGESAAFEHELACHPEGAEAWRNVSILPCTVSGKRGALVQHLDVTDLHQAERRRVLANLVARAMDREDPRREMLRDVVTGVCRVMGWSLAGMWSWDRRTSMLRCDGVVPQPLTGSYGWSALTNVSGLAARAWSTHTAQWADGIEREDAAVTRTALGARSAEVLDAVAVPMGAEGLTDGVVVFYSPHKHRPDAEFIASLTAVLLGASWTPSSRGVSSSPAHAHEETSGTVIELAAASFCPVLLRGGSGVGKARMAREIHARSERARGPYVECNCSTFTTHSFESDLFGVEAGVGGAGTRARRGLFEEAAGGTLLLRNIDGLDRTMQTRLVRVLEQRAFRRVGATRETPIDVRIMATCSRELRADSRRGGFSEDLMARLSSLVIEVPSLNERPEGMSDISTRVLAEIARGYNRPAPTLTTDAISALEEHHWSGNLRELRNVLERAWLGIGREINGANIASAIASLRPKHTETTVAPPPAPVERPATPRPSVSVAMAAVAMDLGPMNDAPVTLAAFERAHIERVLALTNFNMRRAASILGISRSTLYLRTRQYKLTMPSGRRGTLGTECDDPANDVDEAMTNDQFATGT